MNTTAEPIRPPAGQLQILQRWLWLVVAGVSLGSVVVAVGLQHFKDLEPCPLCIVQRYLHLAVAAFALAAALTRARVALACGLSTAAAALGGAAVASHHVWMQQNPLMARCSAQLHRWINEAWTAQALPGVFAGAGDCLADGWQLAGLSMPAWSLVLFCAYLIAAWPALLLTERRPRAA